MSDRHVLSASMVVLLLAGCVEAGTGNPDNSSNRPQRGNTVTWDLRTPTTPTQLGSQFDDVIFAEASGNDDLDVEILLPSDVTVRGDYRLITGDATLRTDQGHIGLLQLIRPDSTSLESLAELVNDFDATWQLTPEARAKWAALLAEWTTTMRDTIAPPVAAGNAHSLDGTTIDGVEPGLVIRVNYGTFSTYTVLEWSPLANGNNEPSDIAPISVDSTSP
jgi:hypothetical protein